MIRHGEYEAGGEQGEQDKPKGADVEEVRDDDAAHDDIEDDREAQIERDVREECGTGRLCREERHVRKSGVEGIGGVEGEQECDKGPPADVIREDKEYGTEHNDDEEVTRPAPGRKHGVRRETTYVRNTSQTRAGRHENSIYHSPVEHFLNQWMEMVSVTGLDFGEFPIVFG